MKKYFILILIFLNSLFNAQIFTFDHIIKYESTTKIPKIPVHHVYHIAVNSLNSDYAFIITPYGIGVLENFNKKEKHFFKIKVLADGHLDYTYLETRKELENKKTYHYNSQFNENGEFKFQTFTNNKKRKVKNEVVIKLREAPFNFLFVEGDHVYQEKELLISKLKSSLNPTKSYLMENVEVLHTNGYTFSCNFINFEKYKLELEVPYNK